MQNVVGTRHQQVTDCLWRDRVSFGCYFGFRGVLRVQIFRNCLNILYAVCPYRKRRTQHDCFNSPAVNRRAAIDQFIDAIRATGLVPPNSIKDDGKIHRFATSDRRRDDAGWLCLLRRQHPPLVPSGPGAPDVTVHGAWTLAARWTPPKSPHIRLSKGRCADNARPRKATRATNASP